MHNATEIIARISDYIKPVDRKVISSDGPPRIFFTDYNAACEAGLITRDPRIRNYVAINGLWYIDIVAIDESADDIEMRRALTQQSFFWMLGMKLRPVECTLRAKNYFVAYECVEA